MNPLSVVVPNWDGKGLIENCLKSLLRQSFDDFKIMVVDNGSTDGSLEIIKSKFPQAKIIELKENVGFARAVNEGIKASKSKYVMLLNNDTKLDKNCLRRLVDSLDSNKGICAVAPKIVSFLKPDIIDSAGDMMNVVGQAFHRGRGEKTSKWDKPGEVFLCTAGACLYRKKAFPKVGLFDESFFIYSEDVDWCFRAQLIGCKFWYEPKAIVYHHHKATTSKTKPKFFEYLIFRNMSITLIKDIPWQLLLRRWRFITIPLVHLNMFLYMMAHGLAKEAFLADLWILTHLPEIIKKRRLIQKARTVSIDYLNKQMEPKKIRAWGLLK